MWQLLKDCIAIRREYADQKTALRNLNKLNWSIEFLTSMLVRAAKLYGGALEMDIKSADGKTITIRSIDAKTPALADDDIFNHLDDETRINSFISQVQGKTK